MQVRKSNRWLAVIPVMALFFGWSCSSPEGDQVTAPQPITQLPAAVKQFDPAVQKAVNAAFQKAKDQPRQANHWAELAQIFHIHGVRDMAHSAYDQALALEPGNHQWHYLRAHVRHSLGHLDAAIGSLADLAQTQPDYAPIWWRRGFWLLEAGNPEDAATCFNKVTASHPEEPAGWVGLARIALSNNQPAEAQRHLTPWLKKDPNALYLHYLMGTALARQGHTSQAQFHLQLGKGAKPAFQDPWYAELGRWRRGYKALIGQAENLWAANQQNAAITLAESLIKEYPERLPAYYFTGDAYVKLGQPEKGLHYYRQIINLKGPDYRAYMVLAGIQRSLQQFNTALEHVAQAESLDPKRADAHLERGKIQMAMGGMPLAAKSFAKAANLDGSQALTAAYQGACALAQGNPQAATTFFRQSQNLDPSLGEAYLGLGLGALRLGNHEPAQRYLKFAFQTTQRDPELFNWLRTRALQDLKAIERAKKTQNP